jgi:predicted RNA-binding Zn ribbon-like protein
MIALLRSEVVGAGAVVVCVLTDNFHFTGGRLSLNFVMTLTGRYRTPGGEERLVHPEDLGRWCQAAGLVTDCPPVLPAELVTARQLREAVYRLVQPDLRGTPRPADVETVNACAGHGGLRRLLCEDARSVRLQIEHQVRSCLAEVAADAVELLSGPYLQYVRECARSGCSMLFLDASRGGRRRWCAMARCGNRSKAARRRQLVNSTSSQPRRPERPSVEGA